MVLIADPDVEARRPLVRVLVDAGFRVVEASDGSEALTMAREIWPGCRHPRDPAWHVVRLRGLPHAEGRPRAELVVIFLSGARTETYDRVAGLLMGADDYVTKPSAPDEVLARLRSATRRAAPSPASATSGRLTRREHGSSTCSLRA